MNTTRRNLRPFGYNGPVPHLCVTDEELRSYVTPEGSTVELEGRVWKWSPIQRVWSTLETPEVPSYDPELAAVLIRG